MMKNTYLTGSFLLLVVVMQMKVTYAFTIESLKLEIFDDKFRVSITNDPDLKWVAFNVNINKEFRTFEAGQLSGLAGMPRDGRWYFDFERPLDDTDIVYIWVALQHNKVIFRDRQGPFSVGAIRTGDPKYLITTTSTTTTTTTTSKPMPVPDNTLGSTKQCFASITEVAVGDNKHCKGDLLFEENFNELDERRWTNEVRLPLYTTDAEFILYNGTAHIDNGILKIPASLYSGSILSGSIDLGHRCTSITSDCSLTAKTHWYLPPVISGRINSKRSFNFKYGRIEVRAKMPKGDWLVPLLLVEPNLKKYGDEDYQSGELRIAFTRGNRLLKVDNTRIDGTRLFGGALLTNTANQRHQFMANITLNEVTGEDNHHFGNEFHVYSLIWKRDELLLSVDNYQYGKINTDFKKTLKDAPWRSGEDDAPLDQMFYLTLGLSAGGHGDFPEGSRTKPWTNTAPKAMLDFYKNREEWYSTWDQPSLEVDYIRVYAV